MDLNSPDTWRWLWIVVAVVFVVGELVSPATFFFLPFAIGAAVSSIALYLGGGFVLGWILFVVVSTIIFGCLWPLGRRLEQADQHQEGVGATRWIGQEALAVTDIAAGGMGDVRLEREIWRAESMAGVPIRKGSTVVVTKVAGTRLVVMAVSDPPDQLPEDLFPQQPTTHTDPPHGNPSQGAQ